MAAPKLKPTATRGRLNSFSSQSSAASTSAVSAWPSCVPWLRPVPRKLKRRTGKPSPHCGIVEGLHGVVDDLVVQGAAAEGMGMADERGKGSIGSALVREGLRAGRRGRPDPRCAVPGFPDDGPGWAVCESGAHSTPHSTRKRGPDSCSARCGGFERVRLSADDWNGGSGLLRRKEMRCIGREPKRMRLRYSGSIMNRSFASCVRLIRLG